MGILILKYAKKYNLEKVILFGSPKDRVNARDIDIGVKGLLFAMFFDFCWEVYRDLSKPVDVVDLSKDSLFNRMKLVIDTNVIISSLLKKSTTREILLNELFFFIYLK